MLKKLLDLYFYSVLTRPWLAIIMIAIVTIGLAIQLPHLKIDASSDSLTLEFDEDLDYFREISKRYQSGDFLVVTYTAKDDLFSDKSLQHLTALRDELLTIEGVVSANSILDVPLLYSPPVGFAELSRGLKTLADNDVDRTLAQQEFLESPIYKDMLLGPNKKTTAILLGLELDETFIELVRERDALRLKRDTEGLSQSETNQLESVTAEFLTYSTATIEEGHERVEKVRDVVAQYKDEAQIFLGGVTMITADMVSFIQSDIAVFGISIIVFIVILLSIIFRQWQFVVLPLLTCLVTVTIMLGFLAAVDWRLTVISSNFVALLLIVTMAMTIHLIVRYREINNQQAGDSQKNMLRETLSSMFLPCLYTALTTMVAFISLVVSGIRPVIDFGWMMVVGLTLAFMLSFLLIPAGLSILPKPKPMPDKDESGVFTLYFSRFTEKYGKLILIIGAFVSIVSVVGMKQLKVENRFIDYFHSSTEIHQGMLVIDQNLGGTISLDIIINHTEEELTGLEDFVTDNEFGGDPFADEVDGFNGDGFGDVDGFDGDGFGDVDGFTDDDPFAGDDPFTESVAQTEETFWFTQAGMQRIEAVHDYLDELPEVGKVQSLAIAYKVARDLNGNDLNDFELALLRQALPEEIKGFLIDPYLAADINQTRLSMRIKETDINLQRNELLKKLKKDLVEKFNFQENEFRITGVLVLYNNLLQSLFSSQILTIGAVFVGILMMFLVLFKSLSLSLIALMPNMLAAFAVLGGMGLVGIPLDMMTITIAAIAVGIGVDNAVHYIYRYRKEFAKTGNYIAAMHNAHGSIGRAMYYTSITIILGFSILFLSKFIPSIYFGVLTGLAMFAAIVASLTLLPKLILIFKPLGAEQLK